ncbi:uncharacterized protein JCM10292_005002 [Rhodotorula paludigena]|uniref:uncharacterized protein n=1 Tax=Rhodotorula paludigena TaxID=86838 RepID=UPI0031763A7E
MQVDSPSQEPLQSSASPAPSAPRRAEEQAPLVTLCFSTSVQSVHRLYSSNLSEEKNELRYGVAAMALHGHTYNFELKFRGPVYKSTGQVGGSNVLEEMAGLAIHEVLSNKNLDVDISFFLSRPSTLENVCLFIWRNITVISAPHPFDICEVSVESTPCPRAGIFTTKQRVSFSGDMIALP